MSWRNISIRSLVFSNFSRYVDFAHGYLCFTCKLKVTHCLEAGGIFSRPYQKNGDENQSFLFLKLIVWSLRGDWANMTPVSSQAGPFCLWNCISSHYYFHSIKRKQIGQDFKKTGRGNIYVDLTGRNKMTFLVKKRKLSNINQSEHQRFFICSKLWVYGLEKRLSPCHNHAMTRGNNMFLGMIILIAKVEPWWVWNKIFIPWHTMIILFDHGCQLASSSAVPKIRKFWKWNRLNSYKKLP